MSRRAVIFDLGGVILGSPLHAIALYERALGIRTGFINGVVVDSDPEGAWSRLERGELSMEDFYPAFERDCGDAGEEISARELMERIGEISQPRPQMLAAVERIRARGLQAAALTNNWVGDGAGTDVLKPHFDVFVESSAVQLRKPDPRIYRHTCLLLGIDPGDAVFLDDIGRNLKPARELGMATIKVVDPDQALGELQEILGFSLGPP
ncbi:MAG: HAD family hydrolase [Myxococcota bacterium]